MGLGSPLGKAGGGGIGNSNSNGLGVDALDGTLLSAASTGGGPPEDFESTQRPSGGACGAGKGLGGAPSRPSANATACSAVDAALKVVPKSPTQPTPPSTGQSPTTRSPRASVGAGLISASPPSSAAAAAAANSPPLPRMGSNVSGGYRSGGSSPRPTGGVMRPATGSSSASVGGAGPAMSLKEMMSDRNKDLSDAERRRAEEYVPLRDAAFREIERLEAEGKWKKM